MKDSSLRVVKVLVVEDEPGIAEVCRRTITSQGYEHEFPSTIAFLTDGRINCEPIITGKIKLNDIIEEGIKALSGEHKEEHLKILVSPED